MAQWIELLIVTALAEQQFGAGQSEQATVLPHTTAIDTESSLWMKVGTDLNQPRKCKVDR
jgi:hypothetical protein